MARIQEMWRPQGRSRAAIAGIVALCSSALLLVALAEYMTKTSFVGFAAAVPVVAVAWLLPRRPAQAVVVLGCVTVVGLALARSLDMLTAAVEVGGLLTIGGLVSLGSRLASAAIERAQMHLALQERDQRLRALEKLTSDLINLLSHELRTPLGVLRGYISMLSDGSIQLDSNPDVVLVLSAKVEELNSLIEGSLASYMQSAVDAVRAVEGPTTPPAPME